MEKNKTEDLQNLVKKREKKDTIIKIKTIIERKLKDFLLCDPSEIDKDIFYMQATQIKIGMNFDRDRAVMKRISSGQTIRAITLITTDPETRKEYIEASMPELSIINQNGGK